jgi:hypothetical protein
VRRTSFEQHTKVNCSLVFSFSFDLGFLLSGGRAALQGRVKLENIWALALVFNESGTFRLREVNEQFGL